MAEQLELSKGIQYWRETNDPMLVDLARAVEEMGKLPEETELVDLLTFYLVFSMGCKEMKLEEESKNFNNRANGMIVGLERMGIKSGSYKNFVLNRNVSGLRDRIVNLATSRSSYRMLELSREIEKK